jgi:ERCC4-related helicase
VPAPQQPGNNKIIIFTAFADTAEYLYEQLSAWAKADLGLESLVTGSGRNQTSLPQLRRSRLILTAFSPAPRSGRPSWPTRANWIC